MSNEDEFLKEIRSSLAEQVQRETDNKKKDNGHRMTDKKKSRKRKKKVNVFIKILIFLLVIILAGGSFLVFTKPGRSIMSKIAVEWAFRNIKKIPDKPAKNASGSAVETGSEEEKGLEVGEITDNIDMSKMSDTFKNALHEDGVYNILLLGVEAIGNNNVASGRTDSIMIATINTKQKTL